MLTQQDLVFHSYNRLLIKNFCNTASANLAQRLSMSSIFLVEEATSEKSVH